MKKEWLLFLLIFFLACFLRLYKIDSIPPGLHGDEAQSGIEAVRILQGQTYNPYSAEVYGQTTFYFYLVAIVFNFLGISATSIRLTSALIGILTIPFFYLFVKSFWNYKVALLATFLLTVSRWHLHFSRLGFMTILITLFQASVFLFLLRGLKTKKTYNFFLAGFFLALGLNSYMAFRFIPFLLLIFLVFYFLRQPQVIRENFKNLLVFLLSTSLFLIPLGLYAFSNWTVFMYRIDSIWIPNAHPFSESVQMMATNLKESLLMFNFKGSTWPHKNLPGAPLLDFLTGIAFVLGLLVSGKKINQPIYFLLFANLLLMLSFSVFTEPIYRPAGDPIRSSGALFSVIIFAALGFSFVLDKVKRFKLAILPLMMIILLLNFKSYFVDFANHPYVWQDFHFIPVEVAKTTKNYPNSRVYLLSDWFYIDYPSIRFLNPTLDGENFFNNLYQYSPQEERMPLRTNLGKNALFVILPKYYKYLETLQNLYPEGKTERHFGGPDNKLIFISYYVPYQVLNDKIDKND